MPSNGETPTLVALVGTNNNLLADSSLSVEVQRGDVVQVWDVSARRMKKITVQALGEALNFAFA